ncbi:MAG TPA: efflux transporter outer membrane subunit [Stellaceae bacterium]|jgi:NodT family efflux transporter outer membrane factor (OMF) lipoprotein|nr:efflux transporter outer membrane subunit [Stellaceae bacterium]
MNRSLPLRPLLASCALIALAACTVGPDYEKPAAPVPATYKEVDGWKPATPKQAASGEAWWSIYNDPVLAGLERQIDISNQTLQASEAAYRLSQALVAEARAGYFPTFDLTGSATRSGNGGRASSSSSRSSSSSSGGFSGGSRGGVAQNNFSVDAEASWAPDIWGAVRRTVESDVASAQQSAANLAAARLLAQATLAADYFQLRVEDELSQLLTDETDAFSRSLQITENRYKVGTAAKTDVMSATAQLENARAQQIATGVQRAEFEHAIAVLVGKPPAEFSITPSKLPAAIPVMPPDLPSQLLERNPTIAANERAMAAANAKIGVAVAGYFPNIQLGASYGQESSLLHTLFTAANSLWSFGLTNISLPIFNGGLTSAQLAAARATYDEIVADYRQAALVAFQQVEDELAASRILERQATVQDRAVVAAREAERLALNQYRAGTVDYTTVITAQATALSNEETAVNLHQTRLVASVNLVLALGGGWNSRQLPSVDEVESGATFLSPPLPPPPANKK